MTRLEQAEQLLERLVSWEQNVFGGSEAPVWRDVRIFLGREEKEDDDE